MSKSLAPLAQHLIGPDEHAVIWIDADGNAVATVYTVDRASLAFGEWSREHPDETAAGIRPIAAASNGWITL